MGSDHIWGQISPTPTPSRSLYGLELVAQGLRPGVPWLKRG